MSQLPPHPKPFEGTSSPARFEGLVTPEAVVLEFETAGIGSWSAAAFIDFGIRFTLLAVIAIASANLVTFHSVWVPVTLLILLTFFLGVAYPAIFESIWDGKTPGKAILGLRVVTIEGAPITFRHAAIRAAIALLELGIAYGLIAVIAVFFSKNQQRLGDMAAGTLVLRERSARQAPTATRFEAPPGLEEYVYSLDVSRLTNAEYLTTRSFLLRLSQLDAGARQSLGGDLARQIVVRINTQPPEWISPEVFLVCVAAAYQRRFASG